MIVGLTLVISTVLCAMAAYGFSRFTTKGINIAFAFIIATMLIPEVVTARPLYEFMQKVKLYDTYSCDCRFHKRQYDCKKSLKKVAPSIAAASSSEIGISPTKFLRIRTVNGITVLI